MTNQKVNTRYSPEARDIYFTVPNLISALRIISIPFISVLISKHEMIAALALIAISSASDGLDGIIARRFNQVSKIGQILDPIADRLLIFCSILALSVAGIIPWWMLIIVGLRDLWMAIQVLWLAQYGYGPLPVHFVGKAGTALLMISIVGLIFADLGTNTFFHLLYIAALAAGIWGIAMYWLAGYIYTEQGIRCYARNWGRSMALEATAPVSFPVPKENEPVRRRAVFSHSVRGAESHHALSPDDAAAIRTRRRRKPTTIRFSSSMILSIVRWIRCSPTHDWSMSIVRPSPSGLIASSYSSSASALALPTAYSCNSCNPIRVSRYGRLWPRNWRIATRK